MIVTAISIPNPLFENGLYISMYVHRQRNAHYTVTICFYQMDSEEKDELFSQDITAQKPPDISLEQFAKTIIQQTDHWKRQYGEHELAVLQSQPGGPNPTFTFRITSE